MAETIAAQSSRPFHHAKSGSTSAVSRNLNKTCKESFTTNGGGTTKTKESGSTTIGRPILNQVLNKMLENNIVSKQVDVKQAVSNQLSVDNKRAKRNGRVNSFVWGNTMSSNNLH
jgi:hypothetical protein